MSERVVLRSPNLRNAVAGQMQDFDGKLHNVLSITFEQHQSLMATVDVDPEVDEMTRVRHLVEAARADAAEGGS
jgi:N-acetylglutamate synthase-like GNAT family acetyltransferase